MSREDACAPVQARDRHGNAARRVIPWLLHEQAYEVYSHLYGREQTAMRMADRGGFSESELIAFLSARPFPKAEWRERVDAYFNGRKPQNV